MKKGVQKGASGAKSGVVRKDRAYDPARGERPRVTVRRQVRQVGKGGKNLLVELDERFEPA